MNKVALIISIFLAGVSVCGQAAGDPVNPSATSTPLPLPPGPLIAPGPGNFSCWVITETMVQQKSSVTARASGEATAKPVTLSQRSFTKTGNVTRVQISSHGTVAEDRWIVNGVQVVLAPSAKYPVVDTSPYLRATDNFSDFSWISAKNFRGVQDYAGHKCLMFADTRNMASSGPAEMVAYGAVIDMETRLPVALLAGGVLQSYQFKEPPTQVQIPPEAVTATIAQMQPPPPNLSAHP